MEYIIYGAGKCGYNAIVFLGPSRVKCFCDNYKTGESFFHKDIINFEKMISIAKNSEDIIVVVALGDEEVRQKFDNQLIEAGITRFFNFVEAEVFSGFESVLPSAATYRKLEAFSYQTLMRMHGIERFHHVAICGCNNYLAYLISEVCMQCDNFTVDYLIDSEPYMGITSASLEEISDKIDCLIINERRADSDIRERIPENPAYSVVDLYDIDGFIPQYQHPELEKYKDIHKGERCFIVGNGPSLKVEDLEALSKHGEICFGVNKIYLAFDKTTWKPDYLCISDPLMIPACDSNIDRQLYRAVFYADDYHWTQNRKVSGVEYIHFISDDYGKNKPNFSEDITKGVYLGFSVVYDICLQLAAYMGFQDIYLLGVDHSFTSNATDPQNHFSSDYYDENDRKQYRRLDMLDANLDKTSRAYEKAERYSKEHGFRIYNATRGGKLEVFERVDFDSLMKQ